MLLKFTSSVFKSRNSAPSGGSKKQLAAVCCTHLQMATIDLIDNFQVARQQMSEQVDWPSLQSLGKDGVVGVGTRAHADVPSLRVSEMKKQKCKKLQRQHLTVQVPKTGRLR